MRALQKGGWFVGLAVMAWSQLAIADGVSLSRIRERVKKQIQKKEVVAPKPVETENLFHNPVLPAEQVTAPDSKEQLAQFVKDLPEYEAFKTLTNSLAKGVSASDVVALLVAARGDSKKRAFLDLVEDLRSLLKQTGQFQTADDRLDKEKLLATLDELGVPRNGFVDRAADELRRRVEQDPAPETLVWK